MLAEDRCMRIQLNYGDGEGQLPNGPREPTTGTLADLARKHIYEDLLANRLAPGERIKPEQLRVRYGIGTSPIREALLLLSAQGLVVTTGHRGFRIPEMSVAELSDIADIRCELSALALKRSIKLGDDEWEAAVLGSCHRMDRALEQLTGDNRKQFEVIEQRNMEFHRALESACGSPWLLRFSELAFHQSHRYFRHFLSASIERARSGQLEHRAIADAAVRRDAKTACALLVEHIRTGADMVRACMEQATKPMGAGSTGGRRSPASQRRKGARKAV
jgi:GntR family carbon starvation induced transcriptional regulator